MLPCRLLRLVVAGAVLLAGVSVIRAASERPNVIIIITDDQGYGDLGLHGNPVLATPHLDRLGRQGVRMENFYVSPVCAPTRASLLTGRYHYRTGVVDTYRGRAMMAPGEATLAELLRSAGYRTGIFGKWHLGDNHPLRAMDQGFDESLVHRGGGIGQPSDPPGGTNYFDPVLWRNGRAMTNRGYCSDVFTDATIDFVRRQTTRPFFTLLAFNAPHTPLIAPPAGYEKYRKQSLAHDRFPTVGQPLVGDADEDAIARVYAMIENIDANVGRLLAALDELRLANNTIVIFLTDNGPQGVRYNGGLRGRKGSVFEGGIRVPCLWRWPAQLPAGVVVDRPAAHIDVVPTVLAACRVRAPRSAVFDGRNLLPWLRNPAAVWPERTLYFQWHRGDAPELYRAFAARSGRFKLVQPESVAETNWVGPPVFQLYDLAHDPYERRDVAADHPDIVERMRTGYEAWFREVGRTRGFAPVRIYLGTRHENPVTLTRQDWRGMRAEWSPRGLGHWEVDVRRAGRYDVTLQFGPVAGGTTAHFDVRDVHAELALPPGAVEARFPDLWLPRGPARLRAWLAAGGTNVGVQFVDVMRR